MEQWIALFFYFLLFLTSSRFFIYSVMSILAFRCRLAPEMATRNCWCKDKHAIRDERNVFSSGTSRLKMETKEKTFHWSNLFTIGSPGRFLGGSNDWSKRVFFDYPEVSRIVSVVLWSKNRHYRSVVGKAEKSSLRHWSASVSPPSMALT